MIELTEQQCNTLTYLLDGLSMKEISLKLGVSYSRTINILNEILIKTGLKNRKELLINGKTLEYDIKKA